jgi:VWFA-related protein
MKATTRTAVCGVLVALAVTIPHIGGVRAGQSPAEERALFEREFVGRFNSIGIENTDGGTEVQSWGGGRLRVVVTRRAGAAAEPASVPPVSFDDTAPAALKISMGSAPQGPDLTLKVYVPADVGLRVRGGKGGVTIKGATGPVSVETGSGDISLYLPATAGTDLSLRTLKGEITSQLPILFFGPLNPRELDGKLNQGGAPVILRSESGSIGLLALSPRDPRADGGREDVSRGAGGEAGQVKPPRGSAPLTADAGAAVDAGAANTEGAGVGRPPVVRTASYANRGAGEGLTEAAAEEVVRIDTHLIHLNVRVADPSGRLLPDLKQDDFLVSENGVRQEIAHFEPVTAPVNLVLLLDLSGSTRDRMKVMKRAARKFVDTLSPDTRIAVAAFTRKFMLVSNFTLDRKLLKDRLDDVKNFHSGTAFYDSMWAALDLFQEAEGKRKAVVVLTDGVDNSLSHDDYEPRHPFDDLLARVTQEEVTVYPIYFDTEYEAVVRRRGGDSHEAYVTARRQLQRVSDSSGGTLFKAERAEDLEGVYRRVASELQALYSISYYPKDKDYDGGWRAVSVQVTRAPAQVRAKPGYYAK